MQREGGRLKEEAKPRQRKPDRPKEKQSQLNRKVLETKRVGER